MQSSFNRAPAPGNRRAAEVLALGEIFSAFGGEAVARQVISQRGGAPEFHAAIGARMRQSVSFDSALGVDLESDYLRKYQLTNLILRGAGVSSLGGLEMTVANEIARNAGVVRNGHAIPWSILARDFTVGTASEAGNLAGSGGRPTEYLRDPLRAQLSLAKLGALITPGFRSDFSVPYFDDDAAASAVGEAGLLTETEPSTGLVAFTAKRIGGYIDVSKQALLYGSEVVEKWMTRILRGIVMTQMEWYAINGNGAGDNPLGIRSLPGIPTVIGGANGALFNWGHLTGLENEAALAGAVDSDFAGYLTNTKIRHLCKNTQRAAGLNFMWEGGPKPLNDTPTAITSNVPSNLVKGTSGAVCSSVVYSADWSTYLVPIFGAPEVLVDHTTRGAEGIVRVIINAWMSAGALQPKNFSKMDDALTA